MTVFVVIPFATLLLSGHCEARSNEAISSAIQRLPRYARNDKISNAYALWLDHRVQLKNLDPAIKSQDVGV